MRGFAAGPGPRNLPPGQVQHHLKGLTHARAGLRSLLLVLLTCLQTLLTFSVMYSNVCDVGVFKQMAALDNATRPRSAGRRQGNRG